MRFVRSRRCEPSSILFLVLSRAHWRELIEDETYQLPLLSAHRPQALFDSIVNAP